MARSTCSHKTLKTINLCVCHMDLATETIVSDEIIDKITDGRLYSKMESAVEANVSKGIRRWELVIESNDRI